MHPPRPIRLPHRLLAAAGLFLGLAVATGLRAAATPPKFVADYNALVDALKLHQPDLARQILAKNPALAHTPPSPFPTPGNVSSFQSVETPLKIAAGLADSEMVALLLQDGAEIEAGYFRPPQRQPWFDVMTPLGAAVQSALFGRDGPGSNRQNRPPDETLLKAQADTIELLLAHGAKADVLLSNGDTGRRGLLEFLLAQSDPRILEIFLKHRALDGMSLPSNSPLAVAVQQGDLVRLRLFLTYLPDVFNAELCRRALIVALTTGQTEAAGLLRAQALPQDVLTSTITGDLAALKREIARSPELLNYHDGLCSVGLLAWAAAARQPEIAAWLLAQGVPVNPPTEITANETYLSCDRPPAPDSTQNCGDPLSIALGMDPRVRPAMNSRTGALSPAAPDAAIVHLLLEHGANANVADIHGVTPLGYTIQNFADPQIAADLLAHGADPNLPSGTGHQLPLELAERRPKEFADLLLKSGATFPIPRP